MVFKKQEFIKKLFYIFIIYFRYAWGQEAFEKSRTENKPIFLSSKSFSTILFEKLRSSCFFLVGYSTCHWCHVMEHESFENNEIAKILNDHYVSIKVDREERPDVDRVYMTYLQVFIFY